jgi:molybdenum cofactor guanylyltransferase
MPVSAKPDIGVVSGVVGVVLCGGRGRRMGLQGGKALASLGGRPLICYPLEALAVVCDRVAVACKAETELPELGGDVERWDEPEQVQHPLAGIINALEQSEGRPVLICATDMPFITPQACRALIEAKSTQSRAVCALSDGRLQPVFCLYMPSALSSLRASGLNEPLTETLLSLNPKTVPIEPRVVRSIDTKDALAAAEVELACRGL